MLSNLVTTYVDEALAQRRRLDIDVLAGYTHTDRMLADILALAGPGAWTES